MDCYICGIGIIGNKCSRGGYVGELLYWVNTPVESSINMLNVDNGIIEENKYILLSAGCPEEMRILIAISVPLTMGG